MKSAEAVAWSCGTLLSIPQGATTSLNKVCAVFDKIKSSLSSVGWVAMFDKNFANSISTGG